MKYREMSVVNNIRKCISEFWLYEEIPDNVISICFHSQRVSDGFELYLYGYDDYYEEHDMWLLSEAFEPKKNYFNLGIESSLLSDQDLYGLYKIEVELYLKENLDCFNSNIKYFCVRFPVGMPELLLER